MGEGGGGHPGGFGDIFGEMFGGRGGGGHQQKRKVKPTVHKLKCTLEDLYKGKSTKIKVNRERLCLDCGGKGGDSVTSCTECDGRGIVVKMRMLGPGMYTQSQEPCDKCRGQGEIIEESSRCKKCKGKKVMKDQKVFDITVDKGSPHGEKHVLHGEGDEIPDAEAGDVIIVVEEQKHKTFKRKGADLLISKEIELVQALTGVDFTITHLDGTKIRIKNEPGEIIKPNSVMSVVDKGMPFHKTSYKNGNLHVAFKVKFPEKIDPSHFDALKAALPKADTNTATDVSETVKLEEFQENPHHQGGEHGVDSDEDEDHMGGGQRVQCQQQ